MYRKVGPCFVLCDSSSLLREPWSSRPRAADGCSSPCRWQVSCVNSTNTTLGMLSVRFYSSAACSTPLAGQDKLAAISINGCSHMGESASQVRRTAPPPLAI